MSAMLTSRRHTAQAANLKPLAGSVARKSDDLPWFREAPCGASRHYFDER
jgi:hypothetical protein